VLEAISKIGTACEFHRCAEKKDERGEAGKDATRPELEGGRLCGHAGLDAVIIWLDSDFAELFCLS